MTTIRVKRAQLLGIIEMNRQKHRAIFEEAIESYRTMAVAELEAMKEAALAGKRIRRVLSLIEPMDQTREYDRAIRMLELSVEDEIALSEADFRQYVMDDWGWKSQFRAANMGYSKTLQETGPEE